MGRSGPPAKPLHLVEVDGNPGHLTKAELAARATVADPGGVPAAPREMSREAKAEWKRLAKSLDAAGMLSSVDRGLLFAWCEAWETLRVATRELRKVKSNRSASVTVTTERGVVLHPAFRAQMQATSTLRQLAGELGLSYAARARTGSVGPMPEADDGPADGGLEGMLG